MSVKRGLLLLALGHLSLPSAFAFIINIQQYSEGETASISWSTETDHHGKDIYIHKDGHRLIQFILGSPRVLDDNKRIAAIGNGRTTFGLRLTNVNTRDAGLYALIIDGEVFGQNSLFIYGKLL